MTKPKTAPISATRPLAARAVDTDGPPEWRPLLEIAGDHSRDFMWMAGLTLENGIRVEAYKHRQTRRYLQLSQDGDAYAYLADVHGGDPLKTPDRYVPTTRHAALELALGEWHLFNEGADDYDDLSRELERVLAIAEAGGRASYDPAWLARQQRYEAAVAKARAFEEATDPCLRGPLPSLGGDNFVGDLASLDQPGGPAAA